MRIDRRFNGPPNAAHGGVACGLFAATVDSCAATVRLVAPVPLDTELTSSREGEVVTISGPAGPVAEVRPAPPADFEPLRWLTPDDVERSGAVWNDWLETTDNLMPTCFGCGNSRPLGDGLELRAGVVPGIDHSAAWWVPDESVASGGLVDDWAVWAAVDCPSGGAVTPLLGDAPGAVLGQFSVWIHRSPEVGGRYQIVGRPLGRDGRRLTSEVGVVAESGEQLAAGRAIWVALPERVSS